MGILLSTGLRRWIVASVAVPLAARALGAAGRGLEKRRGPSHLSRGLRGAGRLIAPRSAGRDTGRDTGHGSRRTGRTRRRRRR